jgi:hypothetical protein
MEKLTEDVSLWGGAKAELDAIDEYETMQDYLGCNHIDVENSPENIRDVCLEIEHIKQEEMEHHAEFLELLNKTYGAKYLPILKGEKEATH